MSQLSVNVITLGCAKNQVDSEKLMQQLSLSGCNVVADSNEPTDIAILNTCGFIADAKEQSIEVLLELLQAKEADKYKKVFVMGCLSQRYPSELRSEIPEVDYLFGVDCIEDILSVLGLKKSPNCLHQRRLSTPGHYAYLKISEGCNRKCSFCIIPSIRGRHRSVPRKELLKEAEFLADLGVRELLLVAQDLSSYGNDLSGDQNLRNLLTDLAGVDGIEWIRLHYAYPAGFPFDVIPLMRNHPKILPYLDIPFQHASDSVLKAMRRGHNAADNREIIRQLRSAIPDMAIRSTLITGFPGETEQDFLLLKEFVEESRFDRLGIFTYSEEEGTAAASLSDNVPGEVKEERKQMLLDIQENISLKKNLSLVGKNIMVLVDQMDDGDAIARSVYDSPDVDQVVWVQNSGSHVLPGTFVEVTVTDAGPFELFAVLNSH